MSRSRTWLIAATALVSLSAVGLGASATRAEEPSYDVPASQPRAGGLNVALSAKNFHVTTGSCTDIPFTVRHDGGYLDSFDAEVEVWRGRKFEGTTYDYQFDSSRPMKASFFQCFSDASDLGTFRLGPTKGDYADDGYATTGSYADSSRIAVTILQHSRLTRPVFGRSSGRRTATTSFSYFDIGASAYRNAPRGTRVDLQKQLASGKWVKVASGKVAGSGKATVTFSDTRTQSYRMVSGRTTYTWNATSSVVRR